MVHTWPERRLRRKKTMETLNLIRFILGSAFIVIGILVFIIEIIGVFKLHYTLNRMHFAGAGDTMALAFTLLGAVLINGFDYASFKLVLVIVFFWFASPVSSHLIARLMFQTDENLEEHVKICDEDESKKFIEE